MNMACHLYVQEQQNLLIVIEIRTVIPSEGATLSVKGHDGGFGDNGNVLYFDLGDYWICK